MSKLKLKNILSELLKEMGETHPVHKDINDKLMQIAKRGSEDEKEENITEAEEKEYTVNYWYRFGKYGDDKDWDDITVKASSEAEAIEKAKQGARKGAMSSSFEIKKGK
jgi:hypothetical protein